LEYFLDSLRSIRKRSSWSRAEIVDPINHMIPDFSHKETGKYRHLKYLIY
jgi:hypothetical protein